MVALHYSTLHRFEIFSAPGTIVHGSIRLPPRSLAKTRGYALAIQSCDAKRLRKRERQKKEKKSKGLISKKKTTTSHVLHTFLFTFLCRCCSNVKLPSYTFYGENVVCAHKKHLLLVFLFAFFFSPPLIFTLLAAGISHFLTVAIKFLCFSSKDNRLLCFLSLVVALCRSFFR